VKSLRRRVDENDVGGRSECLCPWHPSALEIEDNAALLRFST
jgi:hypothetical protein